MSEPQEQDPYELTKREYYAARAMHGLISSYKLNTVLGMENFKVIAESAFAMADSMIEIGKK
jgi:hypothetical protein